MSTKEKLRILRYLILAGALAAGAASAEAAVKKTAKKPAAVEAPAPAETDELATAKLVIDGNAKGETFDAGATLPGETADAAKAPASIEAAPLAASVGGSSQSLPAAKLDVNKLPESEIPVLANVKDAKKSEGGQFARLLATLAVLAITFGGASYGLKKWMAGRNGKQKQNTRIKVLTQHHLGPKKSLMIVQVAGEAILIGMTDQNISMLKTLSLIDDEVPETVPQAFDQSLDHSLNDFEEDSDGNLNHARIDDHFNDAGHDEDFTISGLNEIRDRVSTRKPGSSKNMRRN